MGGGGHGAAIRQRGVPAAAAARRGGHRLDRAVVPPRIRRPRLRGGLPAGAGSRGGHAHPLADPRPPRRARRPPRELPRVRRRQPRSVTPLVTVRVSPDAARAIIFSATRSRWVRLSVVRAAAEFNRTASAKRPAPRRWRTTLPTREPPGVRSRSASKREIGWPKTSRARTVPPLCGDRTRTERMTGTLTPDRAGSSRRL